MTKPSVHVSHEMFETFSPILHLSRFICLQPLKWKKSSDHTWTIIKSKPYLAYSIFVNIFVVFYGIYGLYQAYQIQVIYDIKLKSAPRRYVKFTDLVVVFSTFTISVVTMARKVDKYINYFRHLNKCDQLLRKRPSRTNECLFLTVATVVVVGSVLLYDLSIWVGLGSGSASVYALLSYFSPYYVAYLSMFVMALVYWHLVYSIKIRLTELNERLRRIQNGGRSGRNVLSFKQMTSAQHLYDLMKVYENLSECTSIVNDCCGLVILIILLGCLIHFLVTPYTLRIGVLLNAHAPILLGQGAWLSIHVLRLMLIVEPCYGCLERSKETSVLICKLLLSNVEDDVKISIHTFMSYLSLCKIEFTAFGLARIDRSLLPTASIIAGVVTTYLVILFQFN